jgi:hypothetical protein
MVKNMCFLLGGLREGDRVSIPLLIYQFGVYRRGSLLSQTRVSYINVSCIFVNFYYKY